jgi:hypothetical protein
MCHMILIQSHFGVCFRVMIKSPSKPLCVSIFASLCGVAGVDSEVVTIKDRTEGERTDVP